MLPLNSDAKLRQLVTDLEGLADQALEGAKGVRKGSSEQKRLLDAFSLARKSADQVRMAVSGL